MRRWLTLLLAATLLYGALIGLLTRDFWPWAETYCYDTRRLMPPNDDKLVELGVALGGSPLRTWDMLGRFYSTWEPQQVHPPDFNFLPTLLLRLLMLVLGPFAAYNLLTGLAWLGSALGACALAFRLGAGRWAALLAGALLAFNPISIGVFRFASLDKAGLCLVAPLLLVLLQMRHRPGWRWPVLGAAVVAAMGVTDQYLLVTAWAALLGWGVLLARAAPPGPEAPTRRGAVVRLGLLLGLSALLLSPVLVAELVSLWVPSDTGHRQILYPERAGLVGIWSVLCGGLALAAAALTPRDRRAVTWFLLGAAVLLLSALELRYQLATQALPLLNSMPLVWRLEKINYVVIYAALVLAALAGVGLTQLLERIPAGGRRLAAALLATVAVAGAVGQAAAQVERRHASGADLTLPPSVVPPLREMPRKLRYHLELVGIDRATHHEQVFRANFMIWLDRPLLDWGHNRGRLERHFGPLLRSLEQGRTAIHDPALPATPPRGDVALVLLAYLPEAGVKAGLPLLRSLVAGGCLRRLHQGNNWLLVTSASMWWTRDCARRMVAATARKTADQP